MTNYHTFYLNEDKRSIEKWDFDSNNPIHLIGDYDHNLIASKLLLNLNKFASNKDKTFRLGISLTPRLLHDLEQYSMNTLKEPFLKDKNEMDDFMRSFPEFRTCEVV